MNKLIEWEVMEPLDPELGPPCPDFCEEGYESHTWRYEVDYDGSSLSTDECPICNRGMQIGYMQEHLVGSFEVRLHGELETYGWETREYDFYLHMFVPEDEAP